MNALAFDTLAYVKRLRDAGIDPRHAEAQAEALAAAVQDSFATREDIDQLGRRIDANGDQLGRRIDQVELSLRAEIKDVQLSIIKWLVPLLIGQTAVLAALVKLL